MHIPPLLDIAGRRAIKEDSLGEVTRLLCECIGAILKCKSTTVNDSALQEILKSLQFMQSTSTVQVSVYLCRFILIVHFPQLYHYNELQVCQKYQKQEVHRHYKIVPKLTSLCTLAVVISNKF